MLPGSVLPGAAPAAGTGRAVEQWAERVARDAGFTDVGHTVELFGLCPDHSVNGKSQESIR